MTWNNSYIPPEKTNWQGRLDLPTNSLFYQTVETIDLRDQNLNLQPDANVLLGFSSDEGVKRNFGREGAKEGPDAIRQSLAKLPQHFENLKIYDAGNISCDDGNLEKSQIAFSELISKILNSKCLSIGLGGGHEIAFANFQGIRKAFPDKKIGIINFDAHFDMRPMLTNNQGSSGTPFLQIANLEKDQFDYNVIGIQQTSNTKDLFKTADKHNTKVFLASDVHLGKTNHLLDFIGKVLSNNDLIYLTICLDVFATGFAPGVSAVQPLGLYPWQVIPLIRQLAASKKVVSFDIAELAPRYDIDNITAKLAASLIHEFLHTKENV